MGVMKNLPNPAGDPITNILKGSSVKDSFNPQNTLGEVQETIRKPSGIVYGEKQKPLRTEQKAIDKQAEADEKKAFNRKYNPSGLQI